MFLSRGLRVVGVVFLLLVFLALVWRVKSSLVYDRDVGINILVVTPKQVGILAVRQVEDWVVWLRIPEDLKIQVVNRPDTEYPVGSLWGLDKIEKAQTKLIRSSVADALGVMLPAVMHVSDDGVLPDLLVGDLLSLKAEANLNLFDRWRIRGDLYDLIKRNKLLLVDLPKKSLEKDVEDDGKEFARLNQSIYVWSSDQWVSEKVLAEGVKVSVFNTGDTKGQGLRFSRQLESVGMKVVAVSQDRESGFGRGCNYKIKGNLMATKKVMDRQLFCHYQGDLSAEESARNFGSDMVVWIGG